MQLKEKVKENQEVNNKGVGDDTDFWNMNCPDKILDDDNTKIVIDKMMIDENISWTSDENGLQESEDDFFRKRRTRTTNMNEED